MHYSLPNLLPLPVNAGHPSVVVGGAAGAAGVNGDAAVAEPGGSGTPNAPRPTADKTGGNNNGNGRAAAPCGVDVDRRWVISQKSNGFDSFFGLFRPNKATCNRPLLPISGNLVILHQSHAPW